MGVLAWNRIEYNWGKVSATFPFCLACRAMCLAATASNRGRAVRVYRLAKFGIFSRLDKCGTARQVSELHFISFFHFNSFQGAGFISRGVCGE
jgi:hypothetical protein